MNRSLARLPLLTLLLVAVMTVAFFVFTHEGLYALDDYFYSRYAHQLLTGTFRVQPDPQGLLHDPLKERPLIFGPVAGLYALLGINSISTTLWPLLATLGCAGIVYALYRRRAPVVASAALLLLGLHYFTLDLTRYLYPDNILMLWCLASAAALLRGRQAVRRAGWWGAGFALLNFAALLSKETIMYYLPFYLLVLGRDLLRRQNIRFWLSALLTGTALLAGYLFLYQRYTNDALYRLHLIEHTNEFLKDSNYLLGNRAALAARVTWQPLTFFISVGLGLMLVLAGVALPLARRPGTEARFWLALAGSTLMLYWVGSTSLSQYNPITLLPRMTTPLLPPLALAAGFGVERLWRTGRGYWVAGGLLLVLAAWLHNSLAVLYALPGLYFMSVAGWRQWRGTVFASRPGAPGAAALTLLVLATALSIRPIYFMRKPSVSAHFAQNHVIQQCLNSPASNGVVFVDDYLIGNYDFYYGYQLPRRLRYRRYWARDSVRLAPGQTAWLLLNRATLSNDELTRKLIRYSPDSVLSWYPQRQLIAQTDRVELYKVTIH